MSPTIRSELVLLYENPTPAGDSKNSTFAAACMYETYIHVT